MIMMPPHLTEISVDVWFSMLILTLDSVCYMDESTVQSTACLSDADLIESDSDARLSRWNAPRPTESNAVPSTSVFERRSLFLTIVGLFLVSSITAVPTVFYYWDPMPSDSPSGPDGHKNTDCNSSDVERVQLSDLLRSPCAKSFSWTANSSDSVRNMSVLKCDFESVNRQFSSLLAMLEHTKDIDTCLVYAKPLICHAMFRDCEWETKTGRPSIQQCFQVRDQHCKQWWNWAQGFESTGIASCLVFPECRKYFDNEEETGNLYSFPSTVSQESSAFVTGNRSESNNSMPCQAPLVPTALYNDEFPFKCSPVCLEQSWAPVPERVTFTIMLYVTVVVCWTCCIVTFITWARSPELRKFPQNTLLFLTISYTIAILALSLPIVTGRRRAYCSHDDMISTWKDPTIVCQTQGILAHFGFLSASVWWLCSIINVFTASFSKSLDNIIFRHPKMVFLAEFLVSAIVPAAMVAINLGMEGTYTTSSFYVIVCGPPTVGLYYYTIAMPLQIFVFTGCTLTLLIIMRLRKSQALRASVHSTRRASSKSVTEIGQEALKKRFLLIVIFFPLCFCTMLATISVYDKLMKYMVRDYMDYIHCLNTEKSSGGDCPATHQRYRSVTVAIIDLLMFNVFSVVLMAYILVPPAARSFWARILSRMLAVLSRCMCQSRKKKHIKMKNMKTEEQKPISDARGEECGSMSDPNSDELD